MLIGFVWLAGVLVSACGLIVLFGFILVCCFVCCLLCFAWLVWFVYEFWVVLNA